MTKLHNQGTVVDWILKCWKSIKMSWLTIALEEVMISCEKIATAVITGLKNNLNKNHDILLYISISDLEIKLQLKTFMHFLQRGISYITVLPVIKKSCKEQKQLYVHKYSSKV